MNRVFLHVDATNERAIQLYKRLGLAQEGVCRQAAFSEGKFADRILFATLASEFDWSTVEEGKGKCR